ncbi:MAG: winged helix-turn-helix domain-containing protein [Gammaproteobacteria bacterium]|nr:winged helix-turn-helix domain-containing protein [Gammaproteobacteria bacterium]
MDKIEPSQLRFDEFELDADNARLTRNAQPVPLAPKAFDLLCTLVRHSGQLLTKDKLLDLVWGHQHVSESVLKNVISELRAALSDDAKQPRYIETVARRGYRFVKPEYLQTAPDAKILNSQTPAFPIIGRRAVLAKLSAAWSTAAAGQRQIFWLAGEAGVGKTTLIDNFVAGCRPIRYAHGQCVEQFGIGEPYLPVLEALAMLCRNDPALIPALRTVAPTWLLQFPWLSSEAEREALRCELAGSSQDRMLRELGELLDRYTQHQPLLLVTEDLHWSDHATVHLINHMARRRSPARLMWLASFRLAEVISEEHPLKHLRHELKLHRLCEEIVLDPFSEREVADYIDQRFPGTGISEALVRNVHTHTDGLPLFVVNVIDDLAAQGVFRPGVTGSPADTPMTGVQVPENLAGVIEKQLARLPAELKTLLEVCSVCGVEFRPDTVAEVLQRDVYWVVEHCDDLARRQQWLNAHAARRLPDGTLDTRYSFRHALYKHVFYQRIAARTRALLHGQIAIAMERSRTLGISVTAAELASHYQRGHDLSTALRHYVEAAENALRHFAPTEVLELTADALDLTARITQSTERDEMELALLAHRGVAASQLLGVASPEARQAFERAQLLSGRLPAAPVRAAELSGQGWVFYTRGEFDAALALGKRMLALAEARREPVLSLCAYNLMGATASYQGDVVNGARWLQQGLTIYQQLEDLSVLKTFVVDPGVSMHANLFIPLAHQGAVDQARAQMNAAIALANTVKQPMAQMLAHWCAGIMHSWLGNAEQTLHAAQALNTLINDHGLAQAEGPARWLHGWALARLGQPDQGYTLIMEGYQRHARFDMLCGGTQVLTFVAEALILAERWDEARKQIEDGIALAGRIGEYVFLPDLLMLEARIALGQAHTDLARHALQAACTEAHSHHALWQELAAQVALCELADTQHADRAALQATYDRLHEGFDTRLVRRAQTIFAKA